MLGEKFREVLFAVMPITLIVVILWLTAVPMPGSLVGEFVAGSVLVTIGLSIFLIGVDLGVAPLGAMLGLLLTRKNRVWIVVAGAFVLGFVISLAEPGLLILGNQIDAVTSGAVAGLTILVVVSLGIGVFMVVGFFRLIFNIPLQRILFISYGLVLLLGFFTSREFLAIAFDSSGATTGVLAVPFILSLSLGITALKKDSKASEKDSFGLVAIVSAGAVIAVMILSLFVKVQEYSGSLPDRTPETMPLFRALLGAFPEALRESAIVFLPLAIIFLLVHLVSSLHREELRRIIIGFVYALLGLSLFLVGVNSGFMEVGTQIGAHLVSGRTFLPLVVVAFVLGVVTILAEPAVHVLTRQIEDVTAGYVKKGTVLLALSVGVGTAVSLSVVRVVVSSIQLWHYLLPGYLLAMGLTFVAPKLFVGIAFDAGGVATGPMTATFIMAFIHGAANAHPSANTLVDGFGMIAMVALMPIITLQLLGAFYKVSSRKRGVDVDE
jgi:hypothetical protein